MEHEAYSRLRWRFWQLPWRLREEILLGRQVRTEPIPQTMERVLLDRHRDAGTLDEVLIKIEFHSKRLMRTEDPNVDK